MRQQLKWLIIPLIGMLAGCTTIQTAQTWSNPRTTERSGYSYQIGTFTNANSKEDQENFPDAETIIKKSLETELLQAGFRILETDETSAIITGVITDYYRGRLMGRYTTVGFDVKATDRNTGEILWKGSHTLTTQWHYDYPPTLLANKVSQELVYLIRRSNERADHTR